MLERNDPAETDDRVPQGARHPAVTTRQRCVGQDDRLGSASGVRCHLSHDRYADEIGNEDPSSETPKLY
jgi:hypothetical protein